MKTISAGWLTVALFGAVPGLGTILRRSGIAQMDANLIQRLRSASYLPALLDGLAVPSWLRTSGVKLRL